MYRTLPYFGLFAAAVLLQIFLFDNLSISVYFNPLVYIVFIALLPLETLPVAVLGAGLALGVTMDCVMGAAGINTFLRPTLIGMLYGRENAREGGVPSSARFGERIFVGYLVALTLIHHAVFFSLEALSWIHLPHTLLRIAVSSAVSVGFIWIISRIFTAKLPLRV